MMPVLLLVFISFTAGATATVSATLATHGDWVSAAILLLPALACALLIGPIGAELSVRARGS